METRQIMKALIELNDLIIKYEVVDEETSEHVGKLIRIKERMESAIDGN